MATIKSLGQHWLKDREILDAIAELAVPDDIEAPFGPCPDVCLEIGPGLGTLTSSLLRRFSKVVAVEYDPRLAANLPKSFPGTNLEVVHGDILKFDLSRMKKRYVAVGNIPYYITSPIITKLLTDALRPEKTTLLIQKEVAERICAEPGKMSYFSVFVQAYAETRLVFTVEREYFSPPPKVDSAVITLYPWEEPLVSQEVLKLARAGFSNPRKKLIKNLPYGRATLERAFAAARIDPSARPADLSLIDWENLHAALAKKS